MAAIGGTKDSVISFQGIKKSFLRLRLSCERLSPMFALSFPPTLTMLEIKFGFLVFVRVNHSKRGFGGNEASTTIYGTMPIVRTQ